MSAQTVDTVTPEQLFEAALARYVAHVQELCDRSHVGKREVYSERGRKYVRIVKEYSDEMSTMRMAHTFVDMGTGAVYRAKGWRHPMPHARGTIYTSNSRDYGIDYRGAHKMR